MMKTKTSGLRVALLAAGALMLGATAASAQEYGYGSYENASYQAPSENVDVSVPRYSPGRDRYGAPYRNISMSKDVYFGDLNLRTRHGERILRDRISQTARVMCHQLNVRYPITAPNSPGCYTTAMGDAMAQAHVAIADARGYDRYSRY
jgi:UrcA family protein